MTLRLKEEKLNKGEKMETNIIYAPPAYGLDKTSQTVDTPTLQSCENLESVANPNCQGYSEYRNHEYCWPFPPFTPS